MMERNWLKSVAVVLCTSMLATMSVQVNAGTLDEVDTSPITLTFGVKDLGFPLGDGIHTDENRVLKKIEEETGVTIDFVTYSAEKYGMLAAAGDLPDIILAGDDSNATSMSIIKSGQLLPLDDLLDEYGQNIKKNIPAAIAWSKVAYGNGETTYVLPTNVAYVSSTPIENGFVGIRPRYDIYKAIGSPEITNEDEYLDVLKQMQDYQREKTGDDSIYAISCWTDTGIWPYRWCYPLSCNYTSADHFCFVNMETNDLEYGFTEADGVFWDGIEFFNKAYRMGIFDPDGFVMTSVQYDEKVRTGKVLTDMFGSQPDAALCGEEAICVWLPGSWFPFISGVYGSPYPYGQRSSNFRAITTNCEHPERAMQLLNWLDSLEGMRTLENGVQGVDWDYIDGVPQLIGDMLTAYQEGDSEYINNLLMNAFRFMYSGEVATEDGYPVKLSRAEDFLIQEASAAAKAFAQDFDSSLSYPGQVYDKWVKEGKVLTDLSDEAQKYASFIPPLSDENAAKEAEATNYFMSNVTQLITADSEEAFAKAKESMLDKFIEIGLDKVAEEVYASAEIANKNYELVQKLLEE